jgi:LacI family transcriptional regulator
VRRKPRIKDVAERAGVSTSTVSYVLNEVAGARVAAATRERVRGVAEEVGYRPNALARALRTQRTHTIGFVSDDVATSPYGSGMIRGAQQAARKADSLLLLVNTDDADETCRDVVQALLQRQVDGVVLATMYHRVIDVPDELAAVPHVFLDCRPKSGDGGFVVPDEVGGTEAVLTELLEAGHRRIGHLTDRRRSIAAGMRLATYREVLGRWGIRFDSKLVVADDSDHVGGWRATGRLLDGHRPASAVFCFNDRMAAGAYRAAAERGLVIPKDFSVVGFDDQQAVAEALWPGLTTAALPHFAMGEWAVTTLLKAADNTGRDGLTSGVTMPCELVRRASVGPPADVSPRAVPRTARQRTPSHNSPKRQRPHAAAGKDTT